MDFHQIRYASTGLSEGRVFRPVEYTFTDYNDVAKWQTWTEPFLRTDPNESAQPSLFYGAFGEQAALVRRDQSGGPGSENAHALIGSSTLLSTRLALELSSWSWAQLPGTLTPLSPAWFVGSRTPPTAETRSAEVMARLGPALSHILANGPAPLVLPSSMFTLGLLWAVQEILGALTVGLTGTGTWNLAFETYDDRWNSVDHSGLFLRFRPGAPYPVPYPDYAQVAQRLAERYVEGSLDTELRNLGVLGERDMSARLGRLLQPLPAEPPPPPPPPVPSVADFWDPAQLPAQAPIQIWPTFTGANMAPPPKDSERGAKGGKVTCPMCLTPLSWEDARLYKFDDTVNDYVRLKLPPDAGEELRDRELRTAFVRCRTEESEGVFHYLPYAYGEYGPPAVFGFVGATSSGKTHLLTAMIAQLVRRGLGHGLTQEPIDLVRHQSLVDGQVKALIDDGKVLDTTQRGENGFVDAFLIQENGKTPRPVALFDVSGGELTEIGKAKRFLSVADGLIFVVDAQGLDRTKLGDPTFNTVLNFLAPRLSKVSAAVVLNKSDVLRFEDPAALWLRHEGRELDAELSLAESADVYAYLYERDAGAWIRPYRECKRATLHFASAVGSGAVSDGRFVRGVEPQRVLAPLLSLMAMTGVLTTPEAKKIGI
ncbi:hypothetical protein [Actinocorallia longicatena]|uniref:Uncharacterized protein n=1 Tax=Actinocorallia longicatena TaxID=111803 RepID=A0ABP6QLN8_9ACTN